MSKSSLTSGLSSASQPTDLSSHVAATPFNTTTSTDVSSLPPTALQGVKVLRIVPSKGLTQYSLRVDVRLMAEQERIKAINESIQRQGKRD